MEKRPCNCLNGHAEIGGVKQHDLFEKIDLRRISVLKCPLVITLAAMYGGIFSEV